MNRRLVALVLFVWSAGLAQNHGGLKGKVTSSEDGKPLVGANIVLSATSLGTTSDTQGTFLLLNIPIGRYAVTVSLVGFQPETISPVDIARDRTTNISVKLEPSPVQAAPVVVTASRHEESLRDVPVSISVVDQRALSERNTITLDDALRYVPGVNITKSQVNVRGSTGYSYGAGTRVLMLVDGLPSVSGDTHEIVWETIPPNTIERVEIVKGAGSALYGSSALGGVINVITRPPPETTEVDLRTYGGFYTLPNYQTWQWTDVPRRFGGLAAIYQRRINELSVSSGASRTVDDGYRRNDYWQRWNAWTRFGFALSPRQSLGVFFNFLEQQRGNFLYWKNIDHVFEPPDDQLGEHVESVRWNLGAHYEQIVGNDWSYAVRASWNRSRWEDNIPSASDPGGSRSVSDFVVGEWQMNGRLCLNHFLTGGIFGSASRTATESIFGDHTEHSEAAFLQDEVELPHDSRLTLGGRADITTVQGLTTAGQFNPKIGFVCHPASSMTLRASAGRGYRAPSIAELFTTTEAGGIPIVPNPDLHAERSWSFEIGGSQLIGGELLADASVFRNEFWDLIEPGFNTGGSVQFQNVTRARIIGTELTVTMNWLHRHCQTQIGYTYIDPQDVSTGDALKYRSRHLLYVSSQLFAAPFKCGLDFRYISKFERIDQELVTLGVILNGDQRVPAYVVDCRAGVDWTFGGIPISATIQIDNLFQYYYVDFVGNIAPTRKCTLTLATRL